VITCYLRYTIDPYQLAAFERYSRLILPPAAAAGCASSRRSPTRGSRTGSWRIKPGRRGLRRPPLSRPECSPPAPDGSTWPAPLTLTPRLVHNPRAMRMMPRSFPAISTPRPLPGAEG